MTISWNYARGLAGAVVMMAVPALAQETPDQFDAANAENRRHTEAQSGLRNDALRLRNDRRNELLSCQGAGSAAAENACNRNVEIESRQRSLLLDNRSQQERDTHRTILKGIGVHPSQ